MQGQFNRLQLIEQHQPSILIYGHLFDSFLLVVPVQLPTFDSSNLFMGLQIVYPMRIVSVRTLVLSEH